MTLERVRAVHEDDLDNFLDSLDLLQALVNGTLRCLICGRTIDRDNLLCVIPIGDSIEVCCNDFKCYEETLRLTREG